MSASRSVVVVLTVRDHLTPAVDRFVWRLLFARLNAECRRCGA